MSDLKTNEKKSSVLVIDDERGLRDMLSFGLSDRGYRVVTAGGGKEGIQKAREENFDLVVCDIMMPDVDGVEVLKSIKKDQPLAEVIMATGYATLETAVESMKQGAYDYISKPFAPLDELRLFAGQKVAVRLHDSYARREVARNRSVVPG